MHNYYGIRRLAACTGAIFAAVLTLNACGSQDRHLADSAAPLPDAAQPLGAPAPAGHEALPELAGLGQPQRSVSLTGPGYQDIPLDEHIANAGLTELPGREAEIAGALPAAYGLYGLSGFNGEQLPTALKVTVDNVVGEYYVAFSNYGVNAWTFAGPYTDSVEAEIPFDGLPAGLGSFISPAGNCYLMILVSGAGNSAHLTKLELGVAGGSSAPEPPGILSSETGADGLVLLWTASASSEDADFGGYLLERAPLLSGSYAQLNDQPTRYLHYWDQTAELDTLYRYRCSAVDTSGNRSTPVNYVTSANSASDASSITVMRIKNIKYYGPATVTIDLSESFDPGGLPIDDYVVTYIGWGTEVSSPTPLVELTLQPGCYYISAKTLIGGLDGSTATATVKVYPRWQTDDVTVSPTEAGPVSRLSSGRLGRLGNGDPVLAGIDFAAGAIAGRTSGAGMFDRYISVPLVFSVERINEPEQHDGNVVFPLVTLDSYVAMSCDGSDFDALGGGGRADASTAFSLASAGDTGLFGVYAQFDGVATDLRVQNFKHSVQLADILTNVGFITGLDVVYNEAAAALDIVYGEGGQTHWLRWDPAAQAAVDGTLIDGIANTTYSDLEINPETGEPELVYFRGMRWRHTRFDGAAWSAPVFVDNAVNNQESFDFLFDNGRRCLYGGVAPGNSRLYEYDETAMAWGVVNSQGLGLTGFGAMSAIPGDTPGEIIAADLHITGAAMVTSYRPGDEESVLLEVHQGIGKGRDLRGAGGAGELLVIERGADGSVRLHKSTDGGQTWTPEPAMPAFVTSVDIGAQADGEVYVSMNNANFSGQYELFYYDPGLGLVDQMVSVAGLPSHWPSISNNSLQSSIKWTTYENGTNTLRCRSLNQMSTSATDSNPSAMPVWDSTTTGFDDSLIGVLAGGATIGDSLAGYYREGEDAGVPLYEPLILTAFDLNLGSSDEVRGRDMDSCLSLALSPTIGIFGAVEPREVLCMSYGPFLDAYRFEISILGAYTNSEAILMNTDLSNITTTELRRTASAATAPGLTGLTLFNTMTGGNVHFQWSNFGEWEDLPLPSGIASMGRPELVVGYDGRWHLVWWDFATDEIKVRSTI